MRDKTYNPANKYPIWLLYPDWELKTITVHYVTYLDAISKLGGYRGALMPIFLLFSPVVILYFLVHLSLLIQDIYKNKY